ncbi:ABC transporter ATP-binding protein [Phenylobacterium sp. SCN 70-31]|mgnify:CR=1 FL=1|uniref:ABC transporter ATP-binding protein n=1 Tax=Phenylobacterium sp. SCN 70-31 TaxID=1660129 RepID=UPI000A43C6B1|nr:ABC transporter ATP-binding protein [Phenylobacterium sp. SCN 70-31]
MPSRTLEAPAHADRSARSVDPAARRRLRKFLSYYRPHIPLLAADIACAIVIAATALALPVCANWITRNLSAAAGPEAAIVAILTMGGAMLALVGVQALCTLFVDYQGHVMGARIESRMRQELFEHLQKLSFGFYDRERTGQLMSRITNDLFAVGELCHHGPEDLAISLLKFLGAAAILAWLDPTLTGAILAAFPVAVVYALYFNGRMNVILRQGKAQIGAINARVEDSLSGIRVVKAFGAEAEETRRFAVENDRFLAIRRAGYLSEAHFSVGMEAFAQLVTLAVIVAGAVRVAQGALDVADLLTFLLCVAILIDPVRRAVNFVRLWQQGYTGFQRVMEVLETEPDIRDAPDARTLGRVRGEIRFQDVGFTYRIGGPPVLRGVSLDIRPGEFVALVGASGVGKSTLCALLPRFYEATSGRVLVDGRDVRDVTLESLRRNIGLVQQDVYLFAGTVLENLRYGRPDATRAEVEAAARRACAHDFIRELPDGYDTDIGERGVRLSGGQKQRLTIARAFLKDPPILIFDEATSALDNESERAVQQALTELARARTTLVIAHRLSTVRNADRIVVLAADGVVEEGRHDDLIAADGPYARLHRTQASL